MKKFYRFQLQKKNIVVSAHAGTKHGYHGFTIAMYMNELIMRVDPEHRRLETFFREEFAEPLGESTSARVSRNTPCLVEVFILNCSFIIRKIETRPLDSRSETTSYVYVIDK